MIDRSGFKFWKCWKSEIMYYARLILMQDIPIIYPDISKYTLLSIKVKFYGYYYNTN